MKPAKKPYDPDERRQTIVVSRACLEALRDRMAAYLKDRQLVGPESTMGAAYKSIRDSLAAAPDEQRIAFAASRGGLYWLHEFAVSAVPGSAGEIAAALGIKRAAPVVNSPELREQAEAAWNEAERLESAPSVVKVAEEEKEPQLSLFE